jgi:protocatechuate 3,4-dioxygenase alpha subunit
MTTTDHGITPSQTAGPYFAYALTPGNAYQYPALVGNDLTTPDAVGDVIVITGRLLDGHGKPVPDAFLELWQADGAGRYSSGEHRQNTSFKGFGRSPSDKDGVFGFRTVKPGAVAAPGGGKQAPHINVSIFARGILRRMFTRIYFAGEAANAADPVLALVPADRRDTLIARRDGEVGGVPKYVFDIHLQGDGETVFFEY